MPHERTRTSTNQSGIGAPLKLRIALGATCSLSGSVVCQIRPSERACSEPASHPLQLQGLVPCRRCSEKHKTASQTHRYCNALQASCPIPCGYRACTGTWCPLTNAVLQTRRNALHKKHDREQNPRPDAGLHCIYFVIYFIHASPYISIDRPSERGQSSPALDHRSEGEAPLHPMGGQHLPQGGARLVKNIRPANRIW